MRRLVRFASWLGLTLAAVAVQAGYRVPQDLGPKLDEVFKPWDKKDAPGGAVFVSVHGKIVYEKAFGMANLELDVPNTTSTVFDVGSVSKQFTATCVMLLAEQGKFSIDDEASKYLPEYPVLSDNNITIRQLLDHTSGVRDILSLMVFKTKGLAFSNDDADKTLEAQRSLNFKPGTNWSYSNSNYYLLMKLVEKESGKSLAEFAKEAIFNPLGMTHTLFLDNPTKLIHDRAFGYVPTPKGYRAGLSMIAIDGPGGLWTTLGDMHKWTENWKHNKLGKADPDLFKEMQTKQKLSSGKELPYGLAFFIDDLKGVPRIQHGGDFIGFHALVSWFPEQDVVVWTMSNDGTQNAKTLNDKAAVVALGDAIKQSDAAHTEIRMTEEQLRDYDGKFDLLGKATVYVTHKEDQMKVQVTGQPAVDVYPSEKDKFFYKVVEARIEFHRDDQGKVDSLTIFQAGQEIKCPRAKPYDMPTETQDALIGIYYSTELDVTLNIKRKDGALYAYSNSVLDGEKLTATSKSKFTTAAMTLDVQWDGDHVKAIRVSMPRADNMKFVRLSAPPE